MARINIEDGLFKSMGFMMVVAATGNPDAALGAVVRAYIVAQKYWVPDKNRIPREVWDREQLPDALIKGGLASEDSTGVYMRGSDDQFAWLFQKSVAGRASAASRVDNSRKRVDNSRKPVQRALNTDERTSTSSSSSSSSSFLLSQNSNSLTHVERALGDVAEEEEWPTPPEPRKFAELMAKIKENQRVVATLEHVPTSPDLIEYDAELNELSTKECIEVSRDDI